MSVNELPQTSKALPRGAVCVVIAATSGEQALERCVESVRANTPEATPILTVATTPTAVNRAIERVAPADVVLLSEPCRVAKGWLERLREAALGDTNTATASALADAGTELGLREEMPAVEDPLPAVEDPHAAVQDFAELADGLAARTLRLRPRLTRAVGPCVYVRREAVELGGPLDGELDLSLALEVDFAQRCLLSGLAHVAADDVVVERLAPVPRGDAGAAPPRLPARLLERYPYISASPPLGESAVLAQALEAARGPDRRLSVTLDARALDGAVTGTQVHILELVRALARTGALALRVLVRAERIDRETLELLRELPDTEVLTSEELDPAIPRSTVFHRPQQTFSAGDVALALALGERVVLSQLDLIAYRNPGYFPDRGAWEDYRRASRHGLSAADRVVVFSDHTRRELLVDALVEEARVRVVPPGLDHSVAGESRAPAGLASGDGEPLANGFLLCLGTDFRHKNRVFALRLLASLRQEQGWQGALVLAGTHIDHGSSRELERAFLEEHPGLREAVVRLASVDEEEKAWLIAHAEAVLYPSAYEGFGLVPFESALNGVPCVFAPQSSLAEAAPEGTATILPWDPVQSAAAVHALLTDAGARARHVRALAGAARELTWAAAAAAMVEVYREAAGSPVREAATLARDAAEREQQLSAAHEAVVEMLIGERELVLRDYDELIAELGPGRGLIGPHGSLPEDLQRALLALSARPALSRPLLGVPARAFAWARAVSHMRGSRRH